MPIERKYLLSARRIDENIVLLCRKHPATKRKEYMTEVCGVELRRPVEEGVKVEDAPHWSTANKAIDHARAELPKIKAQIEATRKAVEEARLNTSKNGDPELPDSEDDLFTTYAEMPEDAFEEDDGSSNEAYEPDNFEQDERSAEGLMADEWEHA